MDNPRITEIAAIAPGGACTCAARMSEAMAAVWVCPENILATDFLAEAMA